MTFQLSKLDRTVEVRLVGTVLSTFGVYSSTELR